MMRGKFRNSLNRLICMLLIAAMVAVSVDVPVYAAEENAEAQETDGF